MIFEVEVDKEGNLSKSHPYPWKHFSGKEEIVLELDMLPEASWACPSCKK